MNPITGLPIPPPPQGGWVSTQVFPSTGTTPSPSPQQKVPKGSPDAPVPAQVYLTPIFFNLG